MAYQQRSQPRPCVTAPLTIIAPHFCASAGHYTNVSNREKLNELSSTASLHT